MCQTCPPTHATIWGHVWACPECGTEWLARVAMDPEFIEWEQRDPNVTAREQAVRYPHQQRRPTWVCSDCGRPDCEGCC